MSFSETNAPRKNSSETVLYLLSGILPQDRYFSGKTEVGAA
jgi:hypothetical protein